jgi:hypothetical protein
MWVFEINGGGCVRGSGGPYLAVGPTGGHVGDRTEAQLRDNLVSMDLL